jgi:hypothetical protein
VHLFVREHARRPRPFGQPRIVAAHAHAAERVHVHDVIRDRVFGHQPERANDVHRPARRAPLLAQEHVEDHQDVPAAQFA